MRMTWILATGLLATGAVAQEETPLVATLAQAPGIVLPANTELRMTMNQEVTTRGRTWSQGDTFDLTLTHDVMVGNYVVIPRGSRGVGRITWLTNRGAFGKSGKMDIALEYVVVNGRNIPIAGTYRQEGEGNTLATAGGVIVAGAFAGFITGKSAIIPQGRELIAHTREDLPVALPAGAPVPAAVTAVPVAVSTPPGQD